ncbi:MAG TPA: hypothetical protein VF960_03255 [Chloroflexota bacterium]
MRDPGEIRLFPAAQGLLRSQMMGFAAYIDPCLMAVSPWLLGMSAFRVGGQLIVLFGTPIAGFRQAQAPEILNILRPLSFPATPAVLPSPLYSPPEAEGALRWWVTRVNDLFGAALDPSAYTNASGTYDPTAQMGVLMSLERLFTSVQGILAHARRDDFVRAVLFFDVLDLLTGLGFGSWDTLLSAERCRRQLNDLLEQLPADGGRPLMSRAARAVDALERLTSSLPVAEHGRVRIAVEGSAPYEASRDHATAHYLRLLRNARHSFAGMARDPRDQALLAMHPGEVPDEVSDLSFLHLVRFVMSPRLPGSRGTEEALGPSSTTDSAECGQLQRDLSTTARPR